MVKQVIVVRKDLKKMMKQRGKLGAQIGHAVLAPFLKQMKRMRKFNAFDETYEMILDVDFNSPLDKWITGSFTKICLAVFSEEELLELYDKLIKNDINAVLIKDNGRTVFNGVETYTCLGIIPMESEDIDKFTGHLPLL